MTPAASWPAREEAMTPLASPVIPPPAALEQAVHPAAAAMAVAAAVVAPVASALEDLLQAGISKLGSLASTPLSAPAVLPEQPPVPIDVLLYRGRAAIERCVELRDQARSAGGTMAPAELEELFDLLDLALTS